MEDTTSNSFPETRDPKPETRRTRLGSPCSPVWDEEWIAIIDSIEAERGKRICGARTLSGKPCVLEPNHENGRCRYHGGFNLTGAQPGNRNAVIHGLYSRCIQTCGKHCTMWESCPVAADDVLQLNPKDRPRCPYETAHYEAVVTDNLTRLNVPVDCEPRRRHLAHELAMLQVMMMRAASAMAVNHMVDINLRTHLNNHVTTRKVSVYTEAFLRLSAEYRRLYALFKKEHTDYPSLEARKEQHRRAQHDTSLLSEDQAQLEPAYNSMTWNANENVKAANERMQKGNQDGAKVALDRARIYDPVYTDAVLNPASPLHIPNLMPLAAPP